MIATLSAPVYTIQSIPFVVVDSMGAWPGWLWWLHYECHVQLIK